MKITKQQIQYMVDCYVIDKKNTYQIAKELKISSPTVGKYLKENGIILSPQKYKFNEHYFSTINTGIKAYFLGLLYADGSIDIKKNSCSIKLSEKDKDILEILKREIGSQKPLYYRKKEPIKGTKYIGNAQWKLELNSKILIKDLLNLGLKPNKSLTITFPHLPYSIPDKFMKDFIRGYFDGDGCIYNTQNRIMLNITGSSYFCIGLALFLNKELQIEIQCKQDKRGKSWFFFIHRINDVIKFCNYIYKDNPTVKLDRKYIKFKEYLG